MALRPPGARRRARGGIKVLGICVVVTALAAFGAVQGSSAADAASAAAATTAASAPVLTASATSVTQGTPVTFTYATPSNLLSTTNWIGFYSGGSTPGNGPYGIWEYTQTGTTSPPASGSSPVANGTDTFSTADLAPGTYTVYLLYNNGYEIIGNPVTLQVTPIPVLPGTLTASQTSATAGDQVSFGYTMPSADVNSGDTIAWFAKGADPVTDAPLYAFNQAAAATSGTDTFDTTGLAGGSYDVYLLNQAKSVIAGPVTVAVTNNGPQLPSPGQLPGQPNLLVNGGAEMGNATLTGTQATTVPGWTTTGHLNEVQYDAGTSTLYDFANGSTQGWQPGSGANSVQAVQSFANGPGSCSPGTWCLAVSSQGNGAGGNAPPANASRIAYISPATPLDLSGAPALITYINGYGGAPGASGYTATVTLYSGTNTLSTTTPVQANAWNRVTLNTSGWPYLNQVTKIAVDYHAVGTTTPWTMQYQIGGMFEGSVLPAFSSPGSADRGQNFFAGGAGGVSTGTQTIDVSNAEGQINQGNVAFNLGGWLGGTGSVADDASVTATFLDASGDTLGTATLGPVTPAMRDDTTEFLPEHATGTLPKQTKTVQVTLKISGSQGYADNLSFTISSNAVAAPPLPALPAPETPMPAATSGDPNLIVNGGAEIGEGSFDGIAANTLPGWTVTGLMNEVQYGASDGQGVGGWPTSSTPGPAERGSNFFGGGGGGVSTATQTIDVSKAEGAINQGNVSYDLSGWLGGTGSVTDTATVTATFLDASGDSLGTATLGPVTPAMRDDTTEFLPEDATGTLPENTKSVRVVLTVNGNHPANRNGHGQGYADNLSFTISSAAVPAPALPSQPTATVPGFDHVFVVMMENQDYADIIGNTAQAPYENSLLSQGANLTSMYALSHPSDENYTALAAGTMAEQTGNTQDAENPVQQIGDLVSNAGGTWRTYEQSMNGPCDLGSQDTYTIDDTPFHNFKDVADNQAVCQEHEQPLTQMAVDLKSAATTPQFSWFSANDCDDMEGCGIAAGDTWLSQTLPEIFNSPAWTQQRSLLIITWDEDAADGQANLQKIPTIILGSQGTVQPGSISSHRYTLYSLTRTIEAALNLPSLTANDYYADPVNDIWTTGN